MWVKKNEKIRKRICLTFSGACCNFACPKPTESMEQATVQTNLPVLFI